MIRAARGADAAALQDIERRAGAAFRTVGMDAIAEDEPPALDALAAYAHDGRAWVAVDEHDEPVAYVLVDEVDGAAHIEQVTVDPRYARRGLGAALLDAAAAWARIRGMHALTLMTFADVPWNAPYYERLGFTRIPPTELSAGLRAIRAHERDLGLDRWPRVAMTRPVPPLHPPLA